MPEVARVAFVALKRRNGWKQPDAAKAIDVALPDIAGIDQPGARLRPAAIATVRTWMLSHNHPEVDLWGRERAPKAAEPDQQMSLRLLRVVACEAEPVREARSKPTIYGLQSGTEPGFGYVEHEGRTVGMVERDGSRWRAVHRGQHAGEHRTKRDAVAEVRRLATLTITRAG